MNDSTITQLDPKTLLADVNIRGELKITPEFVASLKRRGVLQAIVGVRTESGQVRVKFGHRRTAGAIEAGLTTVPVHIIGDEGTDRPATIERILAQYDENDARTNLTTTDTLGMVEQLRLLDVSAAQIARESSLTKREVDAAVKVTKSDAAKAAHAEYDLTIDQAATLTEFEDDKKAFDDLLNTCKVNPGSLNHHVSRLRQQRADAKALAMFTEARLVPLGVPVIDRPIWNHAAKPLDRLSNAEGEPFTLESHSECPGHVVWAGEEYGYFRPDGTLIDEDSDEAAELDQQDDPEPEKGTYRSYLVATYGCADPAKHGHLADGRTPRGGEVANLTPEEVAAAHEASLAEKRMVVANNKAWDAAEPVRQEWIKKNIANRRTPPKGTAAFITETLISDTYMVNTPRYTVAKYGFLPEKESTWTENTSEGRLNVVTLLLILTCYEDFSDRQNWRSKPGQTTRYLLWLQDQGYELSDVERIAAKLPPVETTETEAATTGPTQVEVDGVVVAETQHTDLTAD